MCTSSFDNCTQASRGLASKQSAGRLRFNCLNSFAASTLGRQEKINPPHGKPDPVRDGSTGRATSSERVCKASSNVDTRNGRDRARRGCRHGLLRLVDLFLACDLGPENAQRLEHSLRREYHACLGEEILEVLMHVVVSSFQRSDSSARFFSRLSVFLQRTISCARHLLTIALSHGRTWPRCSLPGVCGSTASTHWLPVP